MTDQTSLAAVPVLRRLWLVVLLTCLIIPFPLAMIMLLTGPVYRWRENGWQPIGNGPRYVYGGLLALWLVAVVLKATLLPGGLKGEWERSADPDLAKSTATQQSESGSGGAVKADNREDAPAAAANGSLPEIKITTEDTQYGQALILTDNDDEPFTIERLVFNGRAEEKNCDLPKYGLDVRSTDLSNEAASMQSAYGTQLPVTMKRGDRAVFFSACGAATKLDIYTDRGVKHMTSG